MHTEVLTPNDMERLHQASLELLEDPGMRIMDAELLAALEARGAKIDHTAQVARIPGDLVKALLGELRAEAAAGRPMQVVNGVISAPGGDRVRAKFGGACIHYLDTERGARRPTYDDMVTMIRLGEALENVGVVGNPVLVQTDRDGATIDPRLRTVRGAALVAKHTSKPGSTEVWSSRELDYLVRIGVAVRGSLEALRRQPCFITAKETISPLQLPDTSTDVFKGLADRGLSSTIVPMPLSGASSPVTAAANIALGNAEILGAMVAIRAYCPGAPVSCGVISGILDMATGIASFSAPEAIRQDLGFAQLWRRRYGLSCAMGTGYIDAKYPGVQSGIEKAAKIRAALGEGHHDYPVGILDGGRAFCPEAALLELELATYCEHLAAPPIEVTTETLAIDVIRAAGIGGSCLSAEHTLEHFRRHVWYPELMDRHTAPDLAAARQRDMVHAARDRWQQVVARAEPYRLDPAQEEEIDAIVAEAEASLLAAAP